jgi:hypothetical protein
LWKYIKIKMKNIFSIIIILIMLSCKNDKPEAYIIVNYGNDKSEKIFTNNDRADYRLIKKNGKTYLTCGVNEIVRQDVTSYEYHIIN